MKVPALERCVGDVDVFLRDHWGAAPLLRHSDPGSDFDDLVTLDDLDAMVASRGLSSANLRMVRDGTSLPPGSYTVPAGARSRGHDPLVDASLVYERFSEGATIVLESLHRYLEPLTDLSREFEIALGHRLQVNAYVTPPASQGFDVHRDDHDVFVIQVSGSKHWVVYDRDIEERILIDEEIHPGTVLYIPTGFPHSASTGASASAHLTVGVLIHQAVDVLRAVVELAAEEPAFQERLPSFTSSGPASLDATVARYVEEFRAWFDKVDLSDVTARAARRVMSTAQPILRGQLKQLGLVDSLGGGSEISRRKGATCFVFDGDTTLRVLLPDRELQMPSVASAAMHEIAARDHFQVRDLYRFLDEEGALVLVRRLIREGLLEVTVGT